MAFLSGRRGVALILALMVLVCGSAGTLVVLTLRHVSSSTAADPATSAPAASDTAEPVDDGPECYSDRGSYSSPVVTRGVVPRISS